MKIEGKNAVREYLLSGGKVESLLLQNGLPAPFIAELRALAKEKNAKISFVDKVALDKQSETGRAQGVIAFVSEFEYAELEDILENKPAGKPLFVLLLDGIEDPHNLGSIIRVAECAGVSGVVIPKHRAATVNQTVAKTSAGALAHVKIAKVTNINHVIEELKKRNVFVFAADAVGQSIYETNLEGDIAIVIGGEGKGVGQLTKQLCDAVVSIPMSGKINSLNASVSAGIVVFEALRQRKS